MEITKTMRKLSEEMKNNRYGWWGYCSNCHKDFIFNKNQIIQNFNTYSNNKVMCPHCYHFIEIGDNNYD